MDFNVIVDRISNEVDGNRNFDMYVLVVGALLASRRTCTRCSTLTSTWTAATTIRACGIRVYDRAAERVFRPRDLDEALEAAYEAQEIIQWLQPYVPLYSARTLTVSARTS